MPVISSQSVGFYSSLEKITLNGDNSTFTIPNISINNVNDFKSGKIVLENTTFDPLTPSNQLTSFPSYVNNTNYYFHVVADTDERYGLVKVSNNVNETQGRRIGGFYVNNSGDISDTWDLKSIGLQDGNSVDRLLEYDQVIGTQNQVDAGFADAILANIDTTNSKIKILAGSYTLAANLSLSAVIIDGEEATIDLNSQQLTFNGTCQIILGITNTAANSIQISNTNNDIRLLDKGSVDESHIVINSENNEVDLVGTFRKTNDLRFNTLSKGTNFNVDVNGALEINTISTDPITIDGSTLGADSLSVYLRNAGAGGSGLTYSRNSNNQYWVTGIQNNGNNFLIKPAENVESAGAGLLTINPAGRILIGNETDNSSDTFQVNGTSLLDGNTYIDGTLTVTGDVTFTGNTLQVNVEEVNDEDNMIILNANEAGSGITAGIAGLEFDRGTLTNYRIMFQESSDTMRIGEIGTTQAIATREDTPTNEAIAFWNNTNNQFSTSANLTFPSNILTTTNMSVTSLTPNRLVSTNAANNFVSTTAANIVNGTTNQIVATDDNDGTITLSLANDLDLKQATFKPDTNVAQIKLEQDTTTDGWNLFANSAGGHLDINRVTASPGTGDINLNPGDMINLNGDVTINTVSNGGFFVETTGATSTIFRNDVAGITEHLIISTSNQTTANVSMSFRRSTTFYSIGQKSNGFFGINREGSVANGSLDIALSTAGRTLIGTENDNGIGQLQVDGRLDATSLVVTASGSTNAEFITPTDTTNSSRVHVTNPNAGGAAFSMRNSNSQWCTGIVNNGTAFQIKNTLNIEDPGTPFANFIIGNRVQLGNISGDNGNTVEAHGSFYVTGGTTLNGTLHVNGLTQASFASTVRYNTGTNEITYDTSSIRYKTNLSNQVDTKFLYDIGVKTYNRYVIEKGKITKQIDPRVEVGIIAEELNVLNENLVYRNKKNEIEGYSKEDLVPYLIKALQEQKKEIDELKQLINQ